MELEAEEFEDIVRGLGERPPGINATRGDPERRRADRVAVAAGVVLAAHGVAAPQPRQVQLRCLSRSGIAVFDRLLRQHGDKVLVHLPTSDGRTISVVCAVMNTRVTAAGDFRLGLQFRARADAAASARGGKGAALNAAATVLDAVARGERPEVKDDAAARVRLNLQGLIKPAGADRASTMTFVTIKDISIGGDLSILHHTALRDGEPFVLQVPRTLGRPLTLPCTVARTRYLDDGQYQIDARFEVCTPDPAAATSNGLFGRVRRWLAA